MITVTRTITLTYRDRDMYQRDRSRWNLPEEGNGNFGSSKYWRQSIVVVDDTEED